MTGLSLSRYATEVELICQEIDACDGEIPEGLIARFAEAQTGMAAKVDSWIGMLDAVKSRIALLKEMRERVTRAVKAAENLDKGFKGYIKYNLQNKPDIPFKGESGSFYLHRNPKSVKVDFEFSDKTVYKTIDPALVSLEPTINPYIKEIRFVVLDNEKLKADLEAGMKLSWARIEQDSHIRVKG